MWSGEMWMGSFLPNQLVNRSTFSLSHTPMILLYTREWRVRSVPITWIWSLSWLAMTFFVRNELEPDNQFYGVKLCSSLDLFHRQAKGQRHCSPCLLTYATKTALALVNTTMWPIKYSWIAWGVKSTAYISRMCRLTSFSVPCTWGCQLLHVSALSHPWCMQEQLQNWRKECQWNSKKLTTVDAPWEANTTLLRKKNWHAVISSCNEPEWLELSLKRSYLQISTWNKSLWWCYAAEDLFLKLNRRCDSFQELQWHFCKIADLRVYTRDSYPHHVNLHAHALQSLFGSEIHLSWSSYLVQKTTEEADLCGEPEEHSPAL